MTRRVRWSAVVLGGVLALGPGATDAAAQIRDDGARVGCLRGRPLPACKSFWIVEMQGSTPLAQTRRDLTYGDGSSWAVDSFEHVLEWNVGHMVNIGPSFAVGGVVTAGSGSDEPLTGLKARVRRWLSSNVSVELEGGMLRTNAAHSVYPALTGGTADVRLNIRDQGSFYVRWDGVTLPAQGDLQPGGIDPGGFQQSLSVGVGLGSVPALAGTGALGLGIVVLWGMLLANDS